MFFWNINKLAEQLHRETISQHEKSLYYLASVCGVYCMYMLVALFQPMTVMLFSVCGIAIGLIAVPQCLKINQNNDNKDFIDRMVCLGFVATIKILVYCLGVLAVGMLLARTLFCDDCYPSSVAVSIITQIMIICSIHILFYIIVAQGLRIKK